MSSPEVDRVPRPRRGVVLDVDERGRASLASPGGRQMVALDPTATALWELCDGETTLREMVAAVAALFDAEPTVIEREVGAALAALEDAGLLEWLPVREPPGT